MDEGLYISVIGAGTCDPATEEAAVEVGRLIARAGATLVCGGMGGVMEASCRGALDEGGVTIGILPGTDRSEGNPYLQYVLCAGIGHARNLAVVASGDAVIAVGGEFGTLSEIGLARKAGRPVVLLGSWEISRHGAPAEGTHNAETPRGAVDLALKLATTSGRGLV